MFLISHPNRFIFIHNAKVAGTSIDSSLKKYQYGVIARSLPPKIRSQAEKVFSPNVMFNPHISAKQLKCTFPEEIFESYYKFGFVRNPWDKVVSLYKFILTDPKRQHYNIVSKMESFEEFVDYWSKRVVNKEERLQKDYFFDGDKNLMNYIGRFETLTEDFNIICRMINLNKVQLKHKNSSRKGSDSFLKYYTEQTIEKVAEAYHEDIILFNYSKPQL